MLVAIAIPSSLNAATETTDEEAILNILDAWIGTQLDSDFPRLVSLLHPTTQHLFRDELSASFDQLLLKHSIDQVRAVSGLPAHPKDLQMSDAQCFVLACEQEKLRHPEFVGDPKWLPFDIRETVFHGNDRVDVALSYATHVQTQRTDYSIALPFVVVFQREPSAWLMLSCPLSRAITWNWARDLGSVTSNRERLSRNESTAAR